MSFVCRLELRWEMGFAGRVQHMEAEVTVDELGHEAVERAAA